MTHVHLNLRFKHRMFTYHFILQGVYLFLKKRAYLDGGVYDVYTGKVVTKYTIVTQVYTYDPINT